MDRPSPQDYSKKLDDAQSQTLLQDHVNTLAP